MMNQKNLIKGFLKSAQEAGLTKEQAEKFLQDNLYNGKTAEQLFDDYVSSILKEANVDKNDHTFAYVEGLTKAAFDAGCNETQAANMAKVALHEIRKELSNGGNQKRDIPAKTAAVNNASAVQEAYAQGFLKAARASGLSDREAVVLLKQGATWSNYVPPKDDGILQQILAAIQANPGLAAGGAGGAALGGLAGYGMTEDEDQKGSNALIAALLGGGLGAGAGALGDSTGLFKRLGA